MRKKPVNLGDLICRSGDLSKVAIIDLKEPDQPREYSYSRMIGLIGGVAQYLSRQGFPAGTRIGIASLNRVEYIACYFGIMQAGMVVVPINIKLPQETLEFILEDAEIALVFADAGNRKSFQSRVRTIDFDDSGPEGFHALIHEADFEAVIPSATDLAQILYTSGSTGRPKGVLLTHAGQLWVLEAKNLPPEMAEERQILAQPLYHMNGLIVTKCIFLTGASLVVMPGFSDIGYTEALARYRVTSAFAIPTMFARVERVLAGRPDLDVSALKQIVLASAPLSQALLDRVRAAFPSAVVSNSYGTTEAGAAVFGSHPQGLPTPDLSLGYPVPGSEVRLVDGPSPDMGTLWMRNPALMLGYNKLPEKTQQVMRDGWYVSGDVMRRDKNGFYYFVGRADDMFVCSGENIYPTEVEKLLERHPAVQQAAVVALQDDDRGHVPVAFIVPAAGKQVTTDEVKRFALENGPAYQHPRRIEICKELPLAGTNKIDKTLLSRRAKELEASGGWTSLLQQSVSTDR